MSELLHLEDHGPIATLTFADPDRRNALSAAMFEALEPAIDAVETATGSGGADSCRVLRLRGEGSAFCAGFDLDAMADDGLLPSFLERLGAFCRRLRRLDVVVVAEVHGPAVAGGCAIVSACDLVHAGPDARFGYPVHRLGISPAVSIPTLLPAIESGGARHLMLGGELIDAETAVRLGLAHAVHADRETLASGVEALCGRLAAMDVATLRATKRFLNEIDGTDHDATFAATLSASVACGASDEANRMVAAAREALRNRTRN
ncbi:MAG: putative enoyl-CoA hydratase echA8 [Planctomycetota bacterium]|jgi:methylglutaconyl-CoA hydratase